MTVFIATNFGERDKIISYDQLVYVIGLHVVQFANNWIKKIPRTAKIGRRPSPI